jgi:hypothetical protein
VIIKSHFSVALLIFLLAGCAGMGARKDSEDGETAENTPLLRDYVFPAGLEFRPGAFALPVAAPGVGAITREQRDPLAGLGEDAKRAITESFRNAYVDGLFRGLLLEGTLGGDLVHSWPPEEALCLVQNWRSGETVPNSWGMPSLVLAIRGAGSDDTYILRGGILDQYGKSDGRDRLNGVAGYGAPLGGEFLYRDGIAQWFEHGLIRVDASGRGFFEETEPPALSPARTGDYAGVEENIWKHFQQARRRGRYLNLPDLRADSPPGRLEIPATETLPGGILYFQTFNNASILALFPQVPDFSFRARIMAGPFLEAFLSDTSSAADLEGRLLGGIGNYGLPLTDPYPAPDADSHRETQRFTKGRMDLRR